MQYAFSVWESQVIIRSRGSVMDNMLDYHSSDTKIDHCFSSVLDETLN